MLFFINIVYFEEEKDRSSYYGYGFDKESEISGVGDFYWC